MDDFWTRLDEAAKKYPSKKQLCQEIGISPNSFSNWRKRRTYPSMRVILQLCTHLGVTPESLMIGLGKTIDLVDPNVDLLQPMERNSPDSRELAFAMLLKIRHKGQSDWNDDIHGQTRLPIPDDVSLWITQNKDLINYLMSLRPAQKNMIRVQLRALAEQRDVDNGTGSRSVKTRSE